MNSINILNPNKDSDFQEENPSLKTLPDQEHRTHLATRGRIHDFSIERRIPTNHMGEPIPSITLSRRRSSSSSEGARISPNKSTVEEKK